MTGALNDSLRAFLDMDEAPAGFETDEQIDGFLDMLEARFEAGDQAVDTVDSAALTHQRIESTQHGEWAMRKVAGLNQAERSVTAYKVDAIDRIERWAAEQMKPIERRRRWLVGLLMDYGRRCYEAEVAEKGAAKARKSVKLPSGTIPSSATRPKYVVLDEGALLSFVEADAETYGVLVRRKAEPAKSEWSDEVLGVKDVGEGDETRTIVVFRATGEPVPGVTWDPGGVRTWEVKPDPLD